MGTAEDYSEQAEGSISRGYRLGPVLELSWHE